MSIEHWDSDTGGADLKIIVEVHDFFGLLHHFPLLFSEALLSKYIDLRDAVESDLLLELVWNDSLAVEYLISGIGEFVNGSFTCTTHCLVSRHYNTGHL
jgi:hypothetical protein